MKGRIFLRTAVIIAGLLAGTCAFAQKQLPKKVLIVYYSWSGNTRQLANTIAKHINADILELQPEIPYPTDYGECVRQVKGEAQNKFRPKLKNLPADINGYETIIIGSPIWWHTMAPPVLTFLSAFDFSGKTVLPFYSHGGSGGGTYAKDVKQACRNGRVTDVYGVRGTGGSSMENAIMQWLNKYGIAK